MTTPPPTVQELRELWKPHKERLDALRGSHPTAVRFHRALSWLEAAGRLDAETQVDQLLLNQWIALNALYGQWDDAAHEPVGDRQSWLVFVERIVELDGAAHLAHLLQEHRPLVQAILGNAHLNRHFWQTADANCATFVRQAKQRTEALYAERRWLTILDQLLERVYLLRCQLVHGAATYGSRLNRPALRHCTKLMSLLLPAVLRVWSERGALEDWGLLCYPPLSRAVPPPSAGPARLS